jgi:hypothetical protein
MPSLRRGLNAYKNSMRNKAGTAMKVPDFIV